MPKIQGTPTIYIGIDPGQAGGIAIISTTPWVRVYPMPETERDLWDIVRGIPSRPDSESLPYQRLALIEKVHSMPEQGVASSFTFGVGYGGLRMALIAAGIPFEEVTPQEWMKAYGLKRDKSESKTKWKHRLRAKAQQLFPDLQLWSEPKSVGKQLAVADALLIAEHCRRKRQGVTG